MTIAKAAHAAGVGVETVRFYERRGLVKQPQKPAHGGFREYDAEAVARVGFIRRAQELGFSLREIRELLSLRAEPGTDCSAIRAQATAKRAEVVRKIAELGNIRRALDELIAACPGRGAIRSCSIVKALGVHQLVPTDSEASRTADRATMFRRRQRRNQARSAATAVFGIDGMRCDGCAQTIQFLIGREMGVENVSVSYGDREARVVYAPDDIDENRLAGVIKRAGFRIAGHR